MNALGGVVNEAELVHKEKSPDFRSLKVGTFADGVHIFYTLSLRSS